MSGQQLDDWPKDQASCKFCRFRWECHYLENGLCKENETKETTYERNTAK